MSNTYEMRFRVEVEAENEIDAASKETEIFDRLQSLVNSLNYKMRSQSSTPFPDATVGMKYERTDKYDWQEGDDEYLCSRCRVYWPGEFTVFKGAKGDLPYCVDCAGEGW